MTRHLRAVLPSSTSRDLGVPQKPQHRLSGPAAAKPRPRASMERVRAELDRLKASKEAMAEERARYVRPVARCHPLPLAFSAPGQNLHATSPRAPDPDPSHRAG